MALLLRRDRRPAQRRGCPRRTHPAPASWPNCSTMDTPYGRVDRLRDAKPPRSGGIGRRWHLGSRLVADLSHWWDPVRGGRVVCPPTEVRHGVSILTRELIETSAGAIHAVASRAGVEERYVPRNYRHRAPPDHFLRFKSASSLFRQSRQPIRLPERSARVSNWSWRMVISVLLGPAPRNSTVRSVG